MKVALLIRGPIRPDDQTCIRNIITLKNSILLSSNEDIHIDTYVFTWPQGSEGFISASQAINCTTIIIPEPSLEEWLYLNDAINLKKSFSVKNNIKQHYMCRFATQIIYGLKKYDKVVMSRPDAHIAISKSEIDKNVKGTYSTIHIKNDPVKNPGTGSFINDQFSIADPETMMKAWDYSTLSKLSEYLHHSNIAEHTLQQIVDNNGVETDILHVHEWSLDKNRHQAAVRQPIIQRSVVSDLNSKSLIALIGQGISQSDAGKLLQSSHISANGVFSIDLLDERTSIMCASMPTDEGIIMSTMNKNHDGSGITSSEFALINYLTKNKSPIPLFLFRNSRLTMSLVAEKVFSRTIDEGFYFKPATNASSNSLSKLIASEPGQFALTGPYTSLPAGHYVAIFEISYTGINNRDIFVDVSIDSGTAISSKKITIECLGDVAISCTFDLAQDSNNIEFRIIACDRHNICVRNISAIKISQDH